MANIDPNWFHSSAAQSGAALVAIMGGFMLTKILAITSEKATVEHEQEVLRQRRKIEVDDMEDCQAFIDVGDAERILDEHVLALLDDTPPTPADLVESAFITDGVQEDVQNLLEYRVAEVRSSAAMVDARLQAKLEANERIPWSWDRFELELPDLSPADSDYMERYFRRIVSGWLHEHPTRVEMDMPPIASPGAIQSVQRLRENAHEREQSERARVVRRRNEHRSAVKAVDSQLELLESRRRSLVVPEETRSGFFALFTFTVTGVLLPLTALMLHEPEPVWWIDAIVALGFVVGLGMVLRYVWRSFTSVQQSIHGERVRGGRKRGA